jgi:hypothetical protein
MMGREEHGASGWLFMPGGNKAETKLCAAAVPKMPALSRLLIVSLPSPIRPSAGGGGGSLSD